MRRRLVLIGVILLIGCAPKTTVENNSMEDSAKENVGDDRTETPIESEQDIPKEPVKENLDKDDIEETDEADAGDEEDVIDESGEGGDMDVTQEYLYVSPENLAIVSVEDSSDRFYHYIRGTVYNRADTKRTLLKIIFTVYDGEGNDIGTKSDHLSVLESGNYWEFEVLVPKENVDSYSFTELRAYE